MLADCSVYTKNMPAYRARGVISLKSYRREERSDKDFSLTWKFCDHIDDGPLGQLLRWDVGGEGVEDRRSEAFG